MEIESDRPSIEAVSWEKGAENEMVTVQRGCRGYDVGVAIVIVRRWWVRDGRVDDHWTWRGLVLRRRLVGVGVASQASPRSCRCTRISYPHHRTKQLILSAFERSLSGSLSVII